MPATRLIIASKSLRADPAGMNTADLMQMRLEGSLTAVSSLRTLLPNIAAAADALIERLRRGGTIYTAGNGGSAAQALHLAEELIGRYRENRKALRAVCLNADPTALTCIANDFGFDQVFSRQCEAMLMADDALVVLSTSGRSQNVIQALTCANSRGSLAVGILGKDGGPCRMLCDHSIVVPATDSAFIQDAQQVAIHLICEAMEQAFLMP